MGPQRENNCGIDGAFRGDGDPAGVLEIMGVLERMRVSELMGSLGVIRALRGHPQM